MDECKFSIRYISESSFIKLNSLIRYEKKIETILPIKIEATEKIREIINVIRLIIIF